MQTRITLVRVENDNLFRCFYKLSFINDDERKTFIHHLQNQPDSWDKYVAWVVDPKNNSVEAYIEIAENQKDQLLLDLDKFIHQKEIPFESLFSKFWKKLKRPYWWWKTRHLRI